MIGTRLVRASGRGAYEQLFGVLVQVVDERGDHLGQRGWLAAEGHFAVALLVGESDEERDEPIAVDAQFQAKVFDGAVGALIDPGLVPWVEVGLGFVVFRVGGQRDTGANADADELAEVVGSHVGKELAAGPLAIAGVDDFVPGIDRDTRDDCVYPLASLVELVEEAFEYLPVHRLRV